MSIKLDIGSGKNIRPGFVGLDIVDNGQKYIRNITKGLPFSDDIVSEINLCHVLEHISSGDDIFFFLSEIYRISKNGAKIHIRVPHSNTLEAHDPAHLSYWNENSFRYLEKNSSLCIPEEYVYNFTILKEEKSGIELHVEAIVSKPKIPNILSSKVSIIVVQFGDTVHIKRYIDNLLLWTSGIDYELIIVNNEEDLEKIKEFDSYISSLNNPNIHLIVPGENIGWIKGINLGYDSISPDSDYVIFSNNDVYPTDKGWLQRLLLHFTPMVGAVGPVSNYVMGRQSIMYDHEGIHEESTNMLIGFFMCINRSLLDQIGPLDVSFGLGGADDLDLSIRIRKAGYSLIIARDVYIHHTGSQSFMPVLGEDKYNVYWKNKDTELLHKWGEKEINILHSPTILISCCIPERTDYVHRLFALKLNEMIKPFGGWTIIDAPRGLIHDSRNSMVEYALSINSDYIFFIDDDMLPPSNLFISLYNHNVPIVSGLAFKRTPPYTPCIFKWAFDKKEGLPAASPLILIKSGIHRIDATGFGAILIKAEVFRKLPTPWFEIKDWGEDLDFSWKCHKENIPIYCDTDLIVPHIGDNMIVTEKQFLNHMSTKETESVSLKKR